MLDNSLGKFLGAQPPDHRDFDRYQLYVFPDFKMKPLPSRNLKCDSKILASRKKAGPVGFEFPILAKF